MNGARRTSRRGGPSAARHGLGSRDRSGGAAPLRVLIVDSRAMIAEALRCLLEREEGVEVVRCCATASDAIKTAILLEPDVVLASLRMCGGNGLELLREMRAKGIETPFVLLADFLRDEETMDALRLGAGGVVLEEMPPALLAQCLRKVANSEQWYEKLALGRALERMLRHEEAERRARETLTKRELEVVRLVSAGLRNKDIAGRMNIGEGTVKLYLNTIYRKLEVSGRLELARHAHTHNLV